MSLGILGTSDLEYDSVHEPQERARSDNGPTFGDGDLFLNNAFGQC